MAKLLDELTRPMQNQCPCGGSLVFLHSLNDLECNICGFTIKSISKFIHSSQSEVSRYLYELYIQFKSKKSDPMNQLPAHYRGE